VLTARDDLKLERKIPVLLKIAPDLNQAELSDIVDVVMNDPKVSRRLFGIISVFSF
jgi:dihydroorotate dehydrogenase